MWRSDLSARFNWRELRQEHFDDGNPAEGVMLNADGRKDTLAAGFHLSMRRSARCRALSWK